MNRLNGIVALCLFIAAAAPLEAQSSFRGGPSHTGVYASPAPQQLSLKWTFATGGAIVSSPAVAGGAVYFGSKDGNLYAVDAASGTEVVFQAPATSSRLAIQRLAASKLRYVMSKGK